MNNYIKQAIYIILISITFSIIRYFFIDGDFFLIKKVNDVTAIVSQDYSTISELEEYIYKINEPTLTLCSTISVGFPPSGAWPLRQGR